MLCVKSMTVPRAGRDVSEFTVFLRDPLPELSRPGHTLFEYLHGARFTRVYLDRDAYYDGEPSADVVREVTSAEKRGVVERCDEIVRRLSDPRVDIGYVIAARHGVVAAAAAAGNRFKVSFRVFFSGFKVVYSAIPILLRFMGQDDFWDMSPYKASEQLLGAINGCKGGGDRRVLAPEPEFADRPLSEFIAQNVGDEFQFLDLQAFQQAQESELTGNLDPEATLDVSDVQIQSLVKLLSPARATDRKSWIEVATVLKRAGNGTDEFFELFTEFSGTCADRGKLATDRDLRNQWDSLKVDLCVNPLTVKSLVHWAKTDNPAEYKKLVRLPSFAFCFSKRPTDTQKQELIKAIRNVVPDLGIPDDVVIERRDGRIALDVSDTVCEVDLQTFAVKVGDIYKGMLCGRDVPLNTHLAKVHRRLDPSFNRFTFTRDNFDRGTLTSVSEGIKMDVHNPFSSNAVAKVKIDGERAFTIQQSKPMNLLAESILEAIKNHTRSQFPGAVNYLNIENLQIINNNYGDDDVAALTDTDACDKFMDWFAAEGFRAVKCNGFFYIYDPAEGIYRRFNSERATDLKDFLISLFKKCGEDNLLKHATTTSRMKALIEQVRASIPIDPLFLRRADACSVGRIPFRNGVFVFATGELVDFSPDIVLFHKLPHAFPTDPAEVRDTRETVQEIRRRIVVPIWDECADYVLECSARCAAAMYVDKTFFFCLGNGNSGKGVWMDAIRNAFPGYVGTVVNNNLIYTHQASGDQAKYRSWMIAVRHCRFNFTSEMKIDNSIRLDSNVLKEMSNGGETLLACQNNQDETEFILHGMCWTFANDIPNIQNIESDDALHNRIVFVPMKYRYLVGDKYEKRKDEPNVRRGDDTIKAWIQEPRVAAAIAYMVCTSFRNEKPVPPAEVNRETIEWVPEVDASANPFEGWVELGEPGDFISCEDLYNQALDRGMSISKTKLGKFIGVHFGIRSIRKKINGDQFRGFNLRRVFNNMNA
eukprot:jgi/Tetstr1/447366/TSEL_034803.t1